MALRPVPDELRHLKQLEKVLISQGLLFKKIVIMHGGQFSKIKKRSKKIECPLCINCLRKTSTD